MSKIKLLPGYPYLYETHMHTAQGSACASYSGKQMAVAYKEAGYTGIIITEHNWRGNTAICRALSWVEWIDEFTKGYEEAHKWGEGNGLSVFWGYEACYDGTEFLIYGLTPDFLKSNLRLRTATVAEQYQIVKAAGGMVVHAHPYREAGYIPEVRLFPEYVDAVEGINATHHNRIEKNRYAAYEQKEVYNRRAVAYANEHDLPITAGSDMHDIPLFGGGMAFTRPLASIEDFCSAVLSGEDYLMCDGIKWYGKRGESVRDVRWIEG